jgi:hypothetical protein
VELSGDSHPAAVGSLVGQVGRPVERIAGTHPAAAAGRVVADTQTQPHLLLAEIVGLAVGNILLDPGPALGRTAVVVAVAVVAAGTAEGVAEQGLRLGPVAAVGTVVVALGQIVALELLAGTVSRLAAVPHRYCLHPSYVSLPLPWQPRHLPHQTVERDVPFSTTSSSDLPSQRAAPELAQLSFLFSFYLI